MTPRTLSQVNCQNRPILAMLEAIRRRFAAGQTGLSIFLQERTGTGKTTIARCLALDLGANDNPATSTIHHHGAKLLSLEEIQEMARTLASRQQSFYGRRVLIVDEAQDLTADQMLAFMQLVEANDRHGNTIIIFTAMAADDEITGKKAANWKPLKDRCAKSCAVPELGDVELPEFREAVIRHTAELVAKIGLSLEAGSVCSEAGFSLRAIYGALEAAAVQAGKPVDPAVFMGNDPEIAAAVEAVLRTTEAPRKVEYLPPVSSHSVQNPSPVHTPSNNKRTARQEQFMRNLGDSGVTVLDMVAQIITEAGRPMMPIEIARRFETTYTEIAFVSNNPRCSINANVTKDITINGSGSRFVKIDRKIGLNQF